MEFCFVQRIPFCATVQLLKVEDIIRDMSGLVGYSESNLPNTLPVMRSVLPSLISIPLLRPLLIEISTTTVSTRNLPFTSLPSSKWPKSRFQK